VVLARRAEFALIALGGVFIIFGWGIGHQDWARALGWLFAGCGFAIEMLYGKVFKADRSAQKGQGKQAGHEQVREPGATPSPATDESAS